MSLMAAVPPVAFAQTAFAQTAVGQTGVAQIVVAQPAGSPSAAPLGSPLPGITQPPAAPGVAPSLPKPPRPTAPPVSETGATRPIRNVAVEGVTAFPPPEIARLTDNLTGPAVHEGQIEAARATLVDLYRSAGYVYTTVRAVIRDQDLRFIVVEGYITDVKLEGDVGPVGTQVLRFLDHLINEHPLRTATLERWLLLAQDIPGLTVRSTLNPSTGDPGALTLVAQVSRRPVSGYISADNRGFQYSGPEQGLAVANFDSFTALGERTQLSLYRTFNGTSIFGQASEEMFLGGSGLKLRIYGGAGDNTPSGPLGAIGYNGETRVFGASLSYPLIRTRPQTLTLSAAFDAIESDISNTLGFSGATVRSSFDSLRVLRLGADYALLDTLLGPDRSAVNVVSTRYSQGLSILGASRDNDTTTPPPRLGEKVDFSKVGGELSRVQTLLRINQESTVALRGAVAWQFTGDLLPPEEKFYLGGPTFNRGYYYGQVSGDDAVSTTAELQFNTPLPPVPHLPWELSAQFYTFFDWGRAWQNTSLEANVSLTSTGGGVRLYVGDRAEIDLEGVYRMNRFPNGAGPGVSALNGAAFYWQLLVHF